MPDISMCANDKCLSRKECYRFMAKADSIQSYIKPVVNKEDDKCSYFWKVDKKGRRANGPKRAAR